MADDQEFAELMARLRGGDQDAAATVFHKFANRLIALARSRLGELVRPKMDPEDILQSVFRSFFRRYSEGQFDLGGWDSLWSMLVVITLRKCGHQVEYFHAARRDVKREATPQLKDDSSSSHWEAIARDPTPAEATLLAETVESLLSGLEDRARPVVVLSLQGYSPQEISVQIGRTERTVYRILEHIKKKLEVMRGTAGSPS
jgi:RNA polymerase sigma-70 factor, ECF subfamily